MDRFPDVEAKLSCPPTTTTTTTTTGAAPLLVICRPRVTACLSGLRPQPALSPALPGQPRSAACPEDLLTTFLILCLPALCYSKGGSAQLCVFGVLST
eukprot:scaffold96588_cov48-Phaeocystis_antarctica.AAC.1